MDVSLYPACCGRRLVYETDQDIEATLANIVSQEILGSCSITPTFVSLFGQCQD